MQLLIREGDADDKDDANYVVLQLCQLMVRQAPNFRHRFPAHSKSFYVANTAVDIDMGLQIWKGFFQYVVDTMHIILPTSWFPGASGRLWAACCSMSTIPLPPCKR